ncbi:MAG: hypothetical protein NT069_12425 [Planctomycetota bacterium]|nr:hypothetical protein [Planctomycetota bacterium]
MSTGGGPTGVMRCPTCRAAQEWSHECRRCRCDLTLLREAKAAAESLRRQCLRALNANAPRQAVELAERYVELVGDDNSKELLAVCALLAGDWRTAKTVAASLVR